MFPQDPIMSGLEQKYGPLTWRPKEEIEIFPDIVDSIVSQQLSIKAAATIFGRLKALGPITPEQMIKCPNDQIRSCGISFSKIGYIKGISQAVLTKSLDLSLLDSLTDEQVYEELVKLKGIGKWTAEMLLIFTLQRPDVFSLGDLGLRNAVAKLYSVDRDNLKKIESLSLKWSPHRSAASRYLWKSLEV